MNVILLAGSPAHATRWREAHPDVVVAAQATPDIRKGWDARLFGARIVRLDSWRYDERVVSALHTAHARYGLIDPTGLLGSAGTHRDLHPTSRPNTGSLTTRRAQAKPARRQRNRHGDFTP